MHFFLFPMLTSPRAETELGLDISAAEKGAHQHPSMTGCTAEKPGTLGAVRVACCSWNKRAGSHCT